MNKSFALPSLILLVTLFVCYMAPAQEKPNEKYYPEPFVYKQSDDMLKDSSMKGPLDLKPEIFVQMGHTATGYTSNTVAVFSPGGKYIFSGNDDGKMIMWEAETGREVKSFRCGDHVTDLTLSSDGRYVLSGDSYFGNNINLWDIASGKKIKSFNIKVLNGPPLLFCNYDKYFLSGGTDELIKLWNIESGEAIREYQAISIDPAIKPEVTSLVLTPDGKKFIAGYRYNGQEAKGTTIRVWDINSGENILSFNEGNGWVNALAVTPDGKYVYSGDWDQEGVRVWEVKTGKYVKSFLIGGTSALEISAGGRYLLAGGCMSFCLVEIQSGKVIRKIDKGINGWVQSIKFSPDGRYVILGDQVPQPKMWDLTTGKLIRTYGGYAGQTETAEVTKSGNILMTAHGYSNSVGIWDYKKGILLKTVKNDKMCLLSSASISKDGSLVAFGGYDMAADNSYVMLWDSVNSKKRFQISPDERSGAHTKSMIISDDGRKLTWAAGVNIIVSDAENGREIKKYSHVGQYGIEKISTDAKGRYILSDDQSDTKLIDCKTGEVVKTFNEKCLFSGNGEKLYLLKEDFERNAIILREMDLNTLKEKRFSEISFNGKIVEGDVTRFRYIQNITAGKNPDYLFFSDNENIYRIDLKKSEITAIFKGHSDLITNIETTPDGKLLCSSSHDGTTKFWDIETGKELVRFVSFSDGEWVVITPDGYFNSSPNGAKNINVVVGMNVYSSDNFFDAYYRPDIVTARLKGEDTTQLVQADLTKGIKLPPEVTISIKTKDGGFRVIQPASTNDYAIENGIIKVKVAAKDAGGGIKGIRLFNNDKVVGEDLRGLKVVKNNKLLEQEFDVSLADGENNLRAIGFSLDMTESNPVLALVTYTAPKLEKPDMYILAIGINEYRNSKYNLNYCVDDAKGFVETLVPRAKKIFNNVFVFTVTNRDANRVNLLKIFTELKGKIKTTDVFTLFYAGHGIALDIKDSDGKTLSEFFYVLSEVTQMTDSDKCLAEGITGTELKKILADIKASKQVLFIDACNSGAFAGQFAVRGAAEENALAKLSRATGSVIFASTTKEQFATEFAQLKHGIFTFVVIEAISGSASLSNGQLTALSIQAYVNDKIPEYSKKYKGNEQFPTSFIWGNDFPIGMK